MVERPFDFTNQKEITPMPFTWFKKRWGSKANKFIIPEWFKKYWNPDEASMKYWQKQYELAKKNQEHELPEGCMRMPSNELHQLMAKEFWQIVPKDLSVTTIHGPRVG
jgi:hypothetical protein